MDPRIQNQKREHERKASLRQGNQTLYTQLDGSTADTLDLNEDAPPQGPFDDDWGPESPTSRHQYSSSTDAHAGQPTAISRRFSWQNSGPMSPGRGPSGQERDMRHGNSRARSPTYSEPSPTRRNSTDAKRRGLSVGTAEQDWEEQRGRHAPTPPSQAARGNNSMSANIPRTGGKEKSQSGWIARLGSPFQKAINVILRRKVALSDGFGREILVDPFRTTPTIDVRTGRPYIGNSIRTSKYSYYSFLPRQLYYQFSKFANIYFLCIAILQMIPGLSTTGTYTTIIPLAIFVTISMAKEGYEDLRRHQLDKFENTSQVSRRKGNAWETVVWQDLRVGDVIQLNRDETVPADIVLLNVQGAEDRAYVETMALDGETNLKNKGAPGVLQKMHLSPAETLARNDISFHVEDPNLDLYNFSGNINVAGQKEPVTNDQVLYRGSILRNTNSILGLVLYSGEECKVRMNANKSPRIKSPRVQAVVNRVVLFIAVLVVVLALLLSVLYLTQEPMERKAFYLINATVSIVPVFVSFIIMLNTMIPLSLYVSMEIVKVCQIGFMMGDIDMYDPVTNTPMEAKTSSINEELGQVTHIFSDKTGTLTDNIMKFRNMSVAGAAWLHNPDTEEEEDYAEYVVEGQDYRRVSRPSLEGTPLMGKTEDLVRMMLENPDTEFAKTARFFLLSIALCHTCVSEREGDGFSYSATSPDEVALVQAAQEMGFIYVDRKAGMILVRTPQPDGSELEEEYHVMEVLEFSSKRKRMSMIVRMPDGRVCLFTKGADSTIKELLRQTELTKESSAKVERKATLRKSIEAQDYMRRKSVQQARHSFARTSKSLARQSIVDDPSIGPLSPMSPKRADFVRRANTVDIAQKRKSWHASEPAVDLLDSPDAASPTFPRGRSSLHNTLGGVMEDAANDSSTRQPPSGPDADVFNKCFEHIDYFALDGLRTLLYGYRYIDETEYQQWRKLYQEASTSLDDRNEKIEQTASVIERHLELAGATAIEDKLQQGVPLTIDRMRRAGIKVWVLTGDKRETAMNIGKSCQLIKDFSTVVVLDHTTGDIFLQIQSALTQTRNAVHSVVVVDGQTLALIEADEPLFDFFHALAVFVDSVLCCRSSPAQKATLVRSVRSRVLNSVTLAIGDGSNDVAMIQEAHVGIGIAGREGLQAARSSDYSIAQFRFLTRLLLVHGRWNYIRICKYTLGTFWKEMMFFLTQAMFQKYNGYTGTSLYESWSLSMFNTLFTSLPVIALGVFEKDLNAETLIAVPELYNFGQRSRGFNLRLYFGWSTMSAATAALVFYLPMTLYGQAPFKTDSQLFAFGDLCFTAAIIVINTKLQFFEIHNKTIVAAIVLFLEIGGWFLWNLILAGIYRDNVIYHVRDAFTKHFGKDGLWWTTLILTVAMCWALEIGVKLSRQVIHPRDVDVYQALEKDKALRAKMEVQARAGEEDNTSGMVTAPPKRTKTQQMRRDAEYESLITRSRGGTVGSKQSVDGVLKGAGKLVRFLDPTHGGAKPATPGTPATPDPSRNKPERSEQGFEMSTIDFTPIDYSEPSEYFSRAPTEPDARQSLTQKGKTRSDPIP